MIDGHSARGCPCTERTEHAGARDRLYGIVMVKLNKIYTRTGDRGTTGLGTGDRVAKDHPRVTAYGTVDEANAAIGVAVIEADRADADETARQMARLLRVIQNDLFDVGADLCVPVEGSEKPGSSLRVTDAQVAQLEGWIDEHNEALEPLTSFVLPGGTPLAASLHVARTIVRRAERDTVTLHHAEPEQVNEGTIRYLNRLSDLLFVLSRRANDNGRGDVLWVPGGQRETTGSDARDGESGGPDAS